MGLQQHEEKGPLARPSSAEFFPTSPCARHRLSSHWHAGLSQHHTRSHFEGQSRRGLKSHQRHNFHPGCQTHVSNTLHTGKRRQHSSSWPPA